MAIQNRNTTLPAIWAETAQTEIPTPPVAGVSYRDTTLNATTIETAWPYKTIVDSSDFNQHAFLQDTLIKEAEQYGVMRWNNTATYKKGGLCLAQDEKVYQALRDNQGKEPTSNPDDWKIPFAIDSDIVHKTGDETISGVKTFEDDITAPNQLDYTNITNCITAIPQDIKLEIRNGNIVTADTCTVYKGDGSTYTLPASTNFSHATSAGTFMLIWTGVGARHQNTNLCFSGSTAPAQGSFSGSYAAWYDTTNKVIKLTNDGGSTWIGDNSFPLCVYKSTGSAATSIDQVFNGFGYIGSTIFALPGVEGLIPNGRNVD